MHYPSKMASILRLRVVFFSCFALCLFSSTYSDVDLHGNVDTRQRYVAGDFEAEEQRVRRQANGDGRAGQVDQAGPGANAVHVGPAPGGDRYANFNRARGAPVQNINKNANRYMQQRNFGQNADQAQPGQEWRGNDRQPGNQNQAPVLPVRPQAQEEGYPKMQVPNMPNLHPGPGPRDPPVRGDDTLPEKQFVQRPGLKPVKNTVRRPMRIADHPACTDDIVHLCAKGSKNNFSVLDCLQNAGEKSSSDGDKDIKAELSEGCNKFLWSYKYNLTKDVRFDSAAFEVCKKELKNFQDCAKIEKGHGLLLPCLYDVAENISTAQCRQYISRMKAITFSDYRLIQGFYDKCRADIETQGCGIVNDRGLPSPQNVPHKQGATINCLEKKVADLAEGCKKEIFRVAELSADDYHTDRALYFACKDDRDRFCEGVSAGNGAIYNCLIKNKEKENMSEDCRNKLTTRQKIIYRDPKANYRLARKCREDIKKTKCMQPKDPQGREFRLSALLICLEEAKHNDVKLSGDCVAELEDTRKSLMEDYSVNPEIINGCKDEIRDYCQPLRRGGKTLHCLMKLTQGKTNKISEQCEKALQDLVKTSDAGSNYRIDTALYKACKPVRDKLCKDEEAGDAKVLSCLMEHIYSADMVKECETQLLELQYFVSRDFKLDPLLYKNCKADVKKVCLEEDFENTELPKGVVFACLHRHLHPSEFEEKLSTGCQAQVHRVLRQRAVSVHLNPQIESQCRSDLGKYCTEKTGKGEELLCLQDHIKELEDKCQEKISGFTQEEAEDVRMNRRLMSACAPMIRQFCKEFLTKKVDEGAALQCLIDHKNDDDMNEKCAAGIEHFQLIELTDYRFSFKFKEACRKDVIKYCKSSKDKSSIVKCLSTTVRDDVLHDRQHNVSEECRKQLKVELLQRSEDIKLDPELFQGCEKDVHKFCSNLKAGNARILECLRDHRKDLEEPCHIKLFNRQKEQGQFVKTDYAFMHSCKRMIKQYCVGVAPDNLQKCLKSHRNDPAFDPNCKAVLTRRLISEKEDYRLNPLLQKACRRDMPKFCKEVLTKAKSEQYKSKELQGEMLQCLKMKFASKHLSLDCENYIRESIQEAAMDFRMDPALSRACRDTAKHLCSEQLESPGQGEVEECLKSKLQHGKIQDVKCRTQVIRLLQEGHADVHVDPLLYKACALDIKHYCAGIPPGEGRQMSCLLDSLEDSSIKLHADCQRLLSERRDMWSYAVKVAPPDSIQDLAAAINASASRGYILTCLLVIIGVLFFGGLCCGRATKRVRPELKNK